MRNIDTSGPALLGVSAVVLRGLQVGISAHNDANDSGIIRHAGQLIGPELIQRSEVAALAFDNQPLERYFVAVAHTNYDVFAVYGRDIRINVDDVTIEIMGLHGLAGYPQSDGSHTLSLFGECNPVRTTTEMIGIHGLGKSSRLREAKERHASGCRNRLDSLISPFPHLAPLCNGSECGVRYPESMRQPHKVFGLRVDFTAQYATNGCLGHSGCSRERGLRLQVSAGRHQAFDGLTPLGPGLVLSFRHLPSQFRSKSHSFCMC